MIELFSNIPQRIREQSEFWVNLALKQSNLADGIKMIYDYTNSCLNEEEKDFIDFYFNLKMEQLKNESNND